MKLGSKREEFKSNLLSSIKIYLSILAIVLTGPIVIRLPSHAAFLQEFAPRFGTFVVIVALWEILIRFISKYIFRPSKAYSKIKRVIFIVISFLISVALLYASGHLEDKITHELLALLLVSLGVRGLSQGLSLVGYRNLSFVMMMIYLFGISNFSASLTAAQWYWPFLIVAFALQAGLHAEIYAKEMEINLNPNNKERAGVSFVVLSRLHAAALLLAPVSICLLEYLEFFPKSYLICLLSLAFVLRSAELSRKLERNPSENTQDYLKNIKKVRILSSYATITFIFCFVIAGFVDL